MSRLADRIGEQASPRVRGMARPSRSLVAAVVRGMMSLLLVVLAGAASAAADRAAGPANTTSALRISGPTALPDGTLGAAYGERPMGFDATGGVPPYSWGLYGSNLPGVSGFYAPGPYLVGTPLATGDFTITIEVIDAEPALATRTWTVHVNPPVQMVRSPANRPASSDHPTIEYYDTLRVTGGSSPMHWALIGGALPPGLVLTPDDPYHLGLYAPGSTYGYPTTVGHYAFTVRATDTWASSDTATFTMDVIPTLHITTPGTLGAATVGQSAFVRDVAASGGVPPYQWSWVSWLGALPPGTTLSSAGELAGPPTTPGDYSFWLQAADAGTELPQTQSQSFSLHVNPAPSITASEPFAPAYGGITTSYAFAVAGGTAPMNWIISSGAAPSGMTLDSATGVLSGAPGELGHFVFTVRATDANGVGATHDSEIDVFSPVGVEPASVPTVSYLAAPAPEPARGPTTIAFGLAVRTPVRLEVFDLAGRRVATVASGVYAAGRYRQPWDARGDDGRELASGRYVLRLSSDRVLRTTFIHLR
jgi:Putative Ig domain/FlgD Ig-like domain